MAAKLILLRHGQSEWNKQNLFTGWVDIPLSWEGITEAIAAGKKIAEIPIDIIYTSTLIRAQMTAMIVMSEHKGGKVPVMLHPGEGKQEEDSGPPDADEPPKSEDDFALPFVAQAQR